MPRTASDEDLKKAFRRLAREHHPDLHPPHEKEIHTRKMQEVNEAYSVLSDPEKRTKYDRYGAQWEAAPPPQEETAGRQEQAAPDGFSDFFRQFFGRQQEPYAEPEGPERDIEAQAEISLGDAVRGGKRTFRLAVSRLCPTCHGTGRVGRQICRTCGGVGEIQEDKTVTTRIPPLVREGTLLRLKGQGHPGANGQAPGDLYVRIHLRPDPRFVVDGSDLETRITVMPWVAALGGEVMVQTLEGPLRVRVPKGSHSDQRLRLSGRGLGKGRGVRGDLYLRLLIDNPPTLSPRTEELYQELAEEAHDRVSSH